jgi:hypothetical protein
MANQTRMSDERRFVVTTKLNRAELEALRRLSDVERLPYAQVMRRLIWREAQHLTPVPAHDGARPSETAGAANIDP